MVNLYAADIKGLPDPLEVPESMDGLSEKRKEKIRRYMYPKDRKQSLGAGLLLNKVLSFHGVSADNIEYGENGKPKVQGIYFNLSHSGDMVIMAAQNFAPSKSACFETLSVFLLKF